MARSDMTARFGVDDGDFRAGIARMKFSIQGLTSEWKENERAYKQVGDAQNAQKAKVEGLTLVLKRQQEEMQRLKSAQTEMGKRTKDNAQDYDRLQREMSKLDAGITKTSAALSGQTRVMQAQTAATEKQILADKKLAAEQAELARTYQFREKSLQTLTALQTTNDNATKASANTMRLAKNEQKALAVEQAGLNKSLTTQSQIRKIEAERLTRISSLTNVSTEAVAAQRLKVIQATESLAAYQTQLKLVNANSIKRNPFGTSALAQPFNNAAKASETFMTKSNAAFRSVSSGALNASMGLGIMGVGIYKSAELAGDLQKTYIENNNLLVTSGEDAAESQHAVNEMQKQGAKFSMEYGITQKEISLGYQDLIKRGYDGGQALASMESIMQASIASGDDFNDTLQTSTGVLEAFGMQSKDTEQMTKNTHQVVNELAMAADITATDFKSMGTSMQYAGPVAKMFNVSLSETASAMGVLSNNGQEAQKAGTGFRQVLQRLAGPTTAAQGAMADLGLSVKDFTDQDGSMKNIADIMGIINEKTKGMSDMEKGVFMKTVFGQTGMNTAQILVDNADALGELNEKVKHAADGDGYAADLAKRNMEAVQNQLKQFKAVIAELGVQIGTQMLPVLSEFAKKMVKAFSSKEGQEGLKKFAKGIAEVATGVMNVMGFVADHFDVVKKFAVIWGELWVVSKISKTLQMIRLIKNEMMAMSAINALGSLTGGGVGGKLNKTTERVQAASAASQVGNVAGPAGNVAGATSRVAKNAGKAGMLSKAGVALKGAGRSLGPLSMLMAVPELFSGSIGERIGGFGGSLAGGAAGMAAGAGLGAAAGSVVPGAGNVVGLVAGGILGGVGGMLGADIGRKGGGAAEKGISKTAEKVKKNGGAGKGAIFDAYTKDLQKSKSTASKTQQKAWEDLGKELNISKEAFSVKTGGDKKGNKYTQELEIRVKTARASGEMKAFSDVMKNSSSKLNDQLTQGTAKTVDGQKKQADAYMKTYNTMTKSVTDHYKNKAKQENKNIEAITKNLGMNKKETEAYEKQAQKKQKADKKVEDKQKEIIEVMRQNTSNYYDEVKKITEEGNQDLLDAEKKYGKGTAQYKEAERAIKARTNSRMDAAERKHVKAQGKLNEQLGQKIEKETKISAGKQVNLLEKLKEKKTDISGKEMHEMVKNSKELRDQQINDAEKAHKKSVSAAEKKYKETTEAAEQEYFVNGTISKKQYEDIVGKAEQQKKDAIKAADEQKDKSVKAAKDTHKAVVDEANKQGQEHGIAVDSETANVTEKYTGMKGSIQGFVNDMASGLDGFLKSLNKNWGIDWRWGGKKYAVGTAGTATDETALVGEEGFELAYHKDKGIHALGVNGPEIRDLKAGTSILTHDMSKQFLAMANKLPAHKDGVMGTISDIWDGAKNIAGSMGEGISDSWNGLKGMIGGAWDTVRDFAGKGAQFVWDSIRKATGFDGYSAGGGAIEDTGKKPVSFAGDKIVEMLGAFIKKDEESHRSAPAGSGARRWKGQVEAALSANGLSTSSDMIEKVLRQIQSESGGNEKAVQGGYTDINTITGDLAKGLMQTISATFNSFKHPGHSDIFNGYDNLLAALNYAKTRYGSGLAGLGEGHGYEHGGIITEHQFAELGEKGKREAVIPLDISERSRAIPLLQTAVSEISGAAPHTKPSGVEAATTGGQSVDLTEVLARMDAILGGLEAVVAAVDSSLTPQRVHGAVNRQTQLNSNLQAQMRGI